MTTAPTKFEQTHISMVLDRSGSMTSCRAETIVAVNSYLAKARADANLKEADFQLMIFDNESIDTVRDGAPINVTDLTADDFVPRGYTPLFDAIGRGIGSLDGRLAKSGSGKAILVITTDGAENASRKHSHSSISELIKARQEAGWLVLFLGAGLQAAQQGTSLGVARAYTANIRMDAESLGATSDFLASTNSGYAAQASAADARSWVAGAGASLMTEKQRKAMGDASGGVGLDPADPVAPAPVAPPAPPKDDTWDKTVDRDVWGA